MDGNQVNILEIAGVQSGEIRSLPFQRTFAGEWEENGLSFHEIHFSGSVVNTAGLLRLCGTVQCELTSPCARCLAPVREDFSAEVDQAVVTESGETEEEAILSVGGTIDLLETAENALLPDLPLRLLCKEDCRGLCPVCGKDLNEGECGCEKKAVDPRLAGLADFFK